MSAVDKPNITLPLAASYNTRGIAGFTNAITNHIDQVKINSIYEPVTNSLSGNTTLYLAKRPGVADSGNTYGSSSYVGYLVFRGGGLIGIGAQNMWVFAVNGNDIKASNISGANTVVTAANFIPVYVDNTSISGTETVVLQARSTADNSQRVFYASAINSWSEITDGDFTGLQVVGKMEFMDGYAFAITINTNRLHNSDLNSLANWSSVGYITKQVVQDTTVGLARLGNQIIAFGRDTMEVFRNAGNPTGSPLETVPSLFNRTGMGMAVVSSNAASHYYTNINRRMYFCSNSGVLGLAISVYDGTNVEKVSNLAVDKIINQQTPLGIRNGVWAGRRAIAVQLDTAAATTHRWLVFFPDWKEWFEFNSTVVSPVGHEGNYLGVSGKQDKIYNVSTTSDNYQDAGTNYTMTHQFKFPKKGNDRNFMGMFGVVGDTARSTSTLNVEFSDDDWQTFQTARAIDMTSQQKMILRCGSYRDRGVRMTHTANLDCRMQTVVARID